MQIAIGFWTTLVILIFTAIFVVGVIEEQVHKYRRNTRTHEHTNARTHEKKIERVCSCARVLASS